MTPTRLILVRHGEPALSMHGRCYGRLDPALSTTGRKEMLRAKRRLAGCAAVDIYSSPLRRAMESARLLAGKTASLAIDERLCEMDFGVLEGLTYAEIEERYPDLYREWMQRPTEVTFPGGETLTAMATRVRTALADLRRARPGRTTVVVSHGGVNRIALADALEMPLRSMFRLRQDYACVNVIDYFGDQPVVRALNLHSDNVC